MLFNHFRFTLRRFARQKLTTFFHVLGLTLGISVCMLIGLFIRHELSFDSYEEKAERTYRVNQVWIDFGKKEFHYSTPFPLAAAIRKDIAGLELVTQVHHPFNNIVEINPGKRFKQDHVLMTDPSFLDVFDVKVVQGNGRETLSKPYHALLTEATARKFYGSENPVGKVFRYNNQFDIIVGGVVRDFPGNTHLPASLLLSFASDEKYMGTSLTHYGSVSGGSTFIVLPPGMQPNNSLRASLTGIYDRTVNKEPWMGKESRCDLELQPLSDVHFNSKYAGGGQWIQAINTDWLWFFGSVGFAVLVLACINFINLSTAQALTRAKEVGVRKSIGAGKRQLLMQFLGEALLLAIVAGMLSMLVVQLSLPAINHLLDKQITFDVFDAPMLLVVLVAGILLTALLAGFYPAWLITRFRPAATLKTGTANINPQSAWLRKGLVVVQFSISVCLLIALLLIGRQMEYLRHKDLGFNKENILTVPLSEGSTAAKKELFATRLSEIPGIKGVSFSTSPPSGDKGTAWGTIMSLKGAEDPNGKRVSIILSDEHFYRLYGLQLIAGRFPVPADTTAISESFPVGQRFAKSVVNEKLIRTLGFASPEAALGKRFWIGMNDWTAEITGVVRDFNTAPLHEDIEPTLLTQFIPFCNTANIKIGPGAGIGPVISKIDAAYKDIFSDGVFEFSFLDQQLDALYKTEARLYSLFRIFSALAILISCMGLWGLVNFAARQRVREIGIRKVFGASLPAIVVMLTKDFIFLVCLAIVIAAPLAWWGINRWLQDFAFRIQIGWSAFAIAGAGAILIALLTVSYQAIKSAAANPVKSLRTE